MIKIDSVDALYEEVKRVLDYILADPNLELQFVMLLVCLTTLLITFFCTFLIRRAFGKNQQSSTEKSLEQFNLRLEAFKEDSQEQVAGIQLQVKDLREKIACLQAEQGFLAQDTLEEDVTEVELVDVDDKVKPQVDLSPVDLSPVAFSPVAFSSGLSKTRGRFLGRVKDIFSFSGDIDEGILEKLEEFLIASDLGVQTSASLIEELRLYVKDNKLEGANEYIGFLKDRLKARLNLGPSASLISPAFENLKEHKPKVILMLGVNGVGKTTTIGKLAYDFNKQGSKVLLAACDTFRAAAKEQLSNWAQRANVDIMLGEDNDKPSTIAYRAIHKAIDEKYDTLLIDTAGRLHTRVNLMNELSKVVSILDRELSGAPHETILVLDGTTGQNALQQAREFNKKAAISGIVITKLDGTAKGGVVIAICSELKVPIRYIGLGEGIEELKVFNSTDFIEALFLKEDSSVLTYNAKVRMKKHNQEVSS
jgi:fused signal recognition particle receptor